MIEDGVEPPTLLARADEGSNSRFRKWPILLKKSGS
jgi:hypothetical protein